MAALTCTQPSHLAQTCNFAPHPHPGAAADVGEDTLRSTWTSQPTAWGI